MSALDPRLQVKLEALEERSKELSAQRAEPDVLRTVLIGDRCVELRWVGRDRKLHDIIGRTVDRCCRYRDVVRRGCGIGGRRRSGDHTSAVDRKASAAREAYAEALEDLLSQLSAGAVVNGDVEHYTLLAELAQGAVKLYAREWNEQPSPARLTTMMRFARNLALVGKRLTPSRYELILAGKNTVNDDFAFQLLRLCDHYPFFEENSELPELKVEGDLAEGEAGGETLVLRLRLPRALQEEQQELLDELELEEPPEEEEEGYPDRSSCPRSGPRYSDARCRPRTRAFRP